MEQEPSIASYTVKVEQLTIQSNSILEISVSHIQIELGCTFLNAQTCSQVTEN